MRGSEFFRWKTAQLFCAIRHGTWELLTGDVFTGTLSLQLSFTTQSIPPMDLFWIYQYRFSQPERCLWIVTSQTRPRSQLTLKLIGVKHSIVNFHPLFRYISALCQEDFISVSEHFSCLSVAHTRFQVISANCFLSLKLTVWISFL